MGGLGIISLCKLQGGNSIHLRPQWSGTNVTVQAVPIMQLLGFSQAQLKELNAPQKGGCVERMKKVSLSIVVCCLSA